MKLWYEVALEEQAERESVDTAKLCRYYIPTLDDSLIGISKNDLVVIGADSGLGKSEISLNMAIQNACDGKTVALFFLEGGEKEAISRIKYCRIAQRYYNDYKHHNIKIDYFSWKNNLIKHPIIKEIEAEVQKDLCGKLKDNLYICPINKDFTIDTLVGEMLDFHNLSNVVLPGNGGSSYDLDLIVIDHLQYFSLEQGETEIQSITRIMKTCKDIADHENIPVVLVSHLRKKAQNRGIPDQEDFYGSSNIPKISSTAIVISSDYTKNDFKNNKYPTFFRIVKSRQGLRSNYAIRTIFDLNRRQYETEYDLYLINREGRICASAIKYENLPEWAKKGSLQHKEVEDAGGR